MRWWRCARDGHRATVWIGWLMPKEAIVRCDCGRGIRPALVYVRTEGVEITRQGGFLTGGSEPNPAEATAQSGPSEGSS